MSAIEYAQHKVVEYTILKKAALKAEDYFLAEYYDTLLLLSHKREIIYKTEYRN